MPPPLTIDGHGHHRDVPYRDESWCLEFLFRQRWPGRFVCPRCKTSGEPPKPSRRVACRHCGWSRSITAGTLLYGSKKPLSTWLCAIWHLCTITGPLNGGALKHTLELRSCQTTWRLLQQLRSIMRLADSGRCAGIVEIDAARLPDIGGADRGTTILAAIEIDGTGGRSGKIRLRQYDGLSREQVTRFIKDSTEPGSSVVAPDRAPFHAVCPPDRIYLVETGCRHEEQAQRTITGFHRFFRQLPGPKHSPGRLQDQLDEYSFRVNTADCSDRQALFDRIIAAVMHPGEPLPQTGSVDGANPGGHR